ncbi:MAG: hypothetical protein ACOYL7_18850 [Caldilinea sp.]
MSEIELPKFLDTLRLSWRLDPSIYRLSEQPALALRYALSIVLLAGVSESLGQSVVLFLNRVRPRRFVLALSIAIASHIVGYLLWVSTIWLVGGLLLPQRQPWHQVAAVVGLAYAPQLFAFFELTPYLGNLIWGFLSLWSMAAIVVALQSGLGLELWQALSVSGLGWVLMQALRRTVGRPILFLQAWLQRRAAGVPLTVRLEDVARLRLHQVQNWYLQLETRRRAVRLTPVHRKTHKPHTPADGHFLD